MSFLSGAALTFPNIDPVLIEFGPFAIRWYSLAYIVGLLFAWWYVRRLLTRAATVGGSAVMAPRHVDDFLLWATLGVILGGRLGYVLFYNLDRYLADPVAILRLWDGGMSFHGGYLGVVVAVIWFARHHKIPMLRMGDLIACAAPVGLFLGRVANFINAELWGRTTDVPWAMVFPGAGPLPRHPSQLYEAFLEGVVLFAVLNLMAHYSRAFARPGMLLGIFALGYAASRFAVEFVREPDGHLGLLVGGFTMGQLLTLPMAAFGLAMIWYGLTHALPAAGTGGRGTASGHGRT